MEPRQKTGLIVVGAIGAIALGGLAYWQYTQIMDYTIAFSKVKVRSLDPKKLSFDIFLNYTNKSALGITIAEQEYRVFVNDTYVTRASNGMPNTIAAHSTSGIGINVAFDPLVMAKTLKRSWVDILLVPDRVNIRVECKLKILLFGFFPITVPYTYNATLKEITTLFKQQ